MIFANWEDKRRWLEQQEQQKNSAEQRKQDAEIEVEAEKRVAFVRALIAANAWDTFCESGIQLATLEPIANPGFPKP